MTDREDFNLRPISEKKPDIGHLKRNLIGDANHEANSEFLKSYEERKKMPLILNTGDLLRRENEFWEVTSVRLGALGFENLIGVRRLTKSPQGVAELLMPEEFIAHCDVYHKNRGGK